MASVATANFCSQVDVSQSGFAAPHRSSRPSNATRYTWADSSSGPWPSQVILTASFATGAPSTCPKQKPPMCHQLLLSSTGSACKAGLVTVKSAMQRELIAKANKPWKIAMMQGCKRLDGKVQSFFQSHATSWSQLGINVFGWAHCFWYVWYVLDTHSSGSGSVACYNYQACDIVASCSISRALLKCVKLYIPTMENHPSEALPMSFDEFCRCHQGFPWTSKQKCFNSFVARVTWSGWGEAKSPIRCIAPNSLIRVRLKN